MRQPHLEVGQVARTITLDRVIFANRSTRSHGVVDQEGGRIPFGEVAALINGIEDHLFAHGSTTNRIESRPVGRAILAVVGIGHTPTAIVSRRAFHRRQPSLEFHHVARTVAFCSVIVGVGRCGRLGVLDHNGLGMPDAVARTIHCCPLSDHGVAELAGRVGRHLTQIGHHWCCAMCAVVGSRHRWDSRKRSALKGHIGGSIVESGICVIRYTHRLGHCQCPVFRAICIDDRVNDVGAEVIGHARISIASTRSWGQIDVEVSSAATDSHAIDGAAVGQPTTGAEAAIPVVGSLTHLESEVGQSIPRRHVRRVFQGQQ